MEAIKALSSVRNGVNESFMDENGKYNYKFYGNESYGKVYDDKKIKNQAYLK